MSFELPRLQSAADTAAAMAAITAAVAAGEIVLGEAWYVPLLYAVTYSAANARVQNLDTLLANDGKFNLRELWLKA